MLCNEYDVMNETPKDMDSAVWVIFDQRLP